MPETAELYLKSRDRLPGPLQKNMDKMAERSPDGLFTVLQAALNDLRSGLIESMTEVLENMNEASETITEADSLYLIYKDKMKAKKVAAHIKARFKRRRYSIFKRCRFYKYSLFTKRYTSSTISKIKF